jgi:hypothetical protein
VNQASCAHAPCHLDGHAWGQQIGRSGPETRSGFIPVRPGLVAEVKFFGRYRVGWFGDDVLLSVG